MQDKMTRDGEGHTIKDGQTKQLRATLAAPIFSRSSAATSATDKTRHTDLMVVTATTSCVTSVTRQEQSHPTPP